MEPSSGPFIPHISKPAVVILGPTASGKSQLAQALCQSIGGEIISADSMQIYRGMDIGTGKVMPAEQLVPHYGLDLVEPGTGYSVAMFQDYARHKIQEIDSRGLVPVICGGTGLYIRGIIDGYEYPSGDPGENPFRKQYEGYLEQHGAQALWELLKSRDGASAEIIHPNNARRVVRALELWEEGRSYAVQADKLASIPQVVPAIQIGLQVNPAVLNARIDTRVDGMIDQGLVEEVSTLLDQGFRDAITAPQAIGYKEIVAYMEKKCSLDEAIQQIKIASHRYGKRQRSWFRRDERIHWLDANSYQLETLVKSSRDIIFREQNITREATDYGTGVCETKRLR